MAISKLTMRIIQTREIRNKDADGMLPEHDGAIQGTVMDGRLSDMANLSRARDAAQAWATRERSEAASVANKTTWRGPRKPRGARHNATLQYAAL